MKTVYKTYSQKQARERQKRFERNTGLKWDFYHTGLGWMFTPVVTRETGLDEDLAAKLKPYLSPWGDGFVALAELSGMNLVDVLVAAKTLVHNQQAICGVNRMGNFATISKK